MQARIVRVEDVTMLHSVLFCEHSVDAAANSVEVEFGVKIRAGVPKSPTSQEKVSMLLFY